MKVISYNSKSEFKWKKLDEYISTRTYISGNRASMDDLTVYAALSSVPSGEFVNLARWYKHINAILRRISGVYGEGSGGTVKSFLVAEKAVATSAFATSMSAVSKVIQEYVPVKMSLSESGLKKLNEHLRTRTYISGNRASNDDLTVFAVLPSVPSSGFVNLARWYKHIDDLLIRIPGVYGEGSGGTVKSSLVDDTKMSDYFIGMGFPAQMVSEVILEYGEENKHKLLQGLVTSYRHEVENLEKRILDNEVKSKEREEDLKNQISEIELKSRKTEDEISVREDNLQKQVNSLKSELEKKNHDNSMCLNDIRILKSELGRITDEKNHFKLEIMQEKVNEHEDLLRLLSTQAKEKVLKEQHMEAIKQLSVNIQNLTNYHDDLTEIMSRKRCSNCCSKCLC